MAKSAAQSFAAGETVSREQLLALTPARYLVQGYRDDEGHARAELSTLWPLAAAEQLKAKQVTAQALEQAIAKVAQAAHRGATEAKPLKDSVASVAGPAAEFVTSCVSAVRAAEDVPVMLQHLNQVLQLVALESVLPRR